MIPCLNPQLCGVLNHKPGTVTDCRRGRSSTLAPRPRPAPLGVAPSYSPSGSTESPEVQTEIVAEIELDRVRDITRNMKDTEAGAKQSERVLQMLANDHVRQLADTLDENHLADPDRDFHAELVQSGYDAPQPVNDERLEEARADSRLALQLLTSYDGSLVTFTTNRLRTLRADAYVTEYADQTLDRERDEDNYRQELARIRLQERLLELGVPESESLRLTNRVIMERRQEHALRRRLNQRNYPDADVKDWEPYTVEKGKSLLAETEQ